jgi:tRNA-Thr(GGU) m(6)t(6)A37 methyltransferase TsaA
MLLKTLMAGGCCASYPLNNHSMKADKMSKKKQFFELYPVGRVKIKGKSVSLHILKKYKDALKGLDGFSHAFVLYWFDRNDTPKKRSILQVHPRGNKKNPLTGVFACRAPVRPNLIALSVCKIVSIKDNIVRIDKIDALDNSPVIDIKPYIPHSKHLTEDIRVPDWL